VSETDGDGCALWVFAGETGGKETKSKKLGAKDESFSFLWGKRWVMVRAEGIL
jgi:hypothetical protein